MSETYFIMLDPQADDKACLVSDVSGALRPCSRRAIGRRSRIIAFVPGSDVSVVPTLLGQREKRLDSAALAFAIEDEIAADPVSMHAVLGPATPGAGSRFIFAAAKSRMDAWLEACRTFDVEQICLVPEQSVIGPGESILDLGARLCAWAEDRPISIEKDWPSDVYQSLLGYTPSDPGGSLEPLELLARAYLANGGADLATYEFSCRRTSAFDFSALRAPALLAAALLVALGVESTLSTIAMNRLAPKIETRLVARSTTTDTMADRDGSRLTSGQMRELVAGLYGAISETPGARLKVLRYDGSDGTVRATLVFQELGQEQTLRNAVAARGIRVVAGDLRTDDVGFLSEFRLGGQA